MSDNNSSFCYATWKHNRNRHLAADYDSLNRSDGRLGNFSNINDDDDPWDDEEEVHVDRYTQMASDFDKDEDAQG